MELLYFVYEDRLYTNSKSQIRISCYNLILLLSLNATQLVRKMKNAHHNSLSLSSFDSKSYFLRLAFNGLILVFVFSFLSGCGEVPEAVEQSDGMATIRATIKTAIPLAYASSVAVSATKGYQLPNVVTSNTCASYPCSNIITITAKEGVFPAQLNQYGTIVVVGFWSSETSAILSVSFTDMQAGIGTYPVSSIGTFPIVITANGIKIIYASVDVNITEDPSKIGDAAVQLELDRLNTVAPTNPSTNVSLEMDAWIINVDHMGTAEDFTDDLYNISGAGQYVGVSRDTTSVLQLVMIGTALSNSCVLNPTEGFGVINQIDVNSDNTADPVILGTATVRFQSDYCDGNAIVDVAIGNYFASMGKNVPLDL